MRVLFDHGVPAPLRFALADHTVVTASEMAWDTLSNGDLLSAAEAAFDVMVTTDQNIRYQQNLKGRSLRILVLTTTSWPRIRRNTAAVVDALAAMGPGDYRELSFR